MEIKLKINDNKHKPLYKNSNFYHLKYHFLSKKNKKVRFSINQSIKMIAFIKIEEKKFLIKIRYHPKKKDFFDSLNCEQLIIESNVRSFPLEKLDNVTNGLLELNVSVKECDEFPAEKYDLQKVIKYKIENDVLDVYAPFNLKLNDMYKSIDNYKFNSQTRRWCFPADQFKQLENKAKQIGYSMELELCELATPKPKTIKAVFKKDNSKNI